MGDDQLGHEELLTTRLSLRRPTPAAIDAIYRIHHDPAATAHNPADMLTTRADAEDRYQRWEQHWHQHGFGYWVIHPREVDGQRDILGFCGLKLMRLQNREILNLFYRLDPAVWGNGIATEAATAVVSWATPTCQTVPSSLASDRTTSPPPQWPNEPDCAATRTSTPPEKTASTGSSSRTGHQARRSRPARPSRRETDRSSDPIQTHKHTQRRQMKRPSERRWRRRPGTPVARSSTGQGSPRGKTRCRAKGGPTARAVG